MFEIYRDKAGRWRWHFIAGNSRIMGDSGQGYDSPAAAERAVERIRALIGDAEVRVRRPRARRIVRRKPNTTALAQAARQPTPLLRARPPQRTALLSAMLDQRQGRAR